MDERWYNIRVNFTVILLIIIFVINSGAQFLLYSNQNVLAEFFFGSTAPEYVANIRWIIAGSLLVSAATMIFWGYISDKYSKKNILILSSLVWIAACYLIFFLPHITYLQLFLAQIFFGLGFGAVWPICYSLLGDIVKPENRGKVFSIVNMVTGSGLVIGLFLGSAFAAWWQFPFLIISIIGSVLILFFFILGTDIKRGAAEHELRAVIEEGAVYTYEIRLEHLKAIWKKKTNFNLFIQGIPGVIPWAVFLILAPIFFQDLGFESNTANFIVILPQVTSVFGSIFAGWYGDRLAKHSQRNRVLFVALSILIPVPFFFGAFLLPYPTVGPDAGLGAFWSVPLYILGFVLIAIGSFLAGSAGVNWYSIVEDINEPETRATIISFHNLTDRIGNSIGPMLAAILGPLLAMGAARSDAMIIAIGILFWIPCAYFWFRAMRTVEQDVLQMKTLLKERSKELEQGLKST
jgi:MFS family permease